MCKRVGNFCKAVPIFRCIILNVLVFLVVLWSRGFFVMYFVIAINIS